MRLALFTLLGVGLASAAFAQSDRPERPYTGVFNADAHQKGDHVLSVGLSGMFGYDSNLLAGPADGSTPSSGGSEAGTYGQFSGTADYSLNRTRFGFSGSGSASARHSSVNQGLQPAYGVGLAGWVQAAKRTKVSFSESSSLQPYLSYSLFPISPDASIAELVAPNYETAITAARQEANSVGLNVTQNLTARASLTAGGGYNVFGSSNGLYNMTSYSAQGRFSYNLSRGLGVHAGYGYGDGRYAQASNVTVPAARTIDVGVDYNRPLSFSRRTTLSFGTGSTGLRDQLGTQYHITGNATLSYEIKRSWNASLAYSRSAGFVQTLRAPVFGDSLTASVGGFMTRRVRLSTGVSAAIGNVGFAATPSNHYGSYSGTAGAIVGLSRGAAFTANYSYYRYSFDNTAQLPLLSTPELSRQTVQVGFTLRPSLGRARRPNASR